MKLEFTYDHHHAIAGWQSRGRADWLTDIFEAPAHKIRARCTPDIRQYVVSEFQATGWAINPVLDQESRLSVFAMSDDLAFQIQMGNVSRVAYDLLKLQHLFQSKRIECAALAVPTKLAATKVGSNITNAERLCNELDLFDRIITVPIFVIAFQ